MIFLHVLAGLSSFACFWSLLFEQIWHVSIARVSKWLFCFLFEGKDAAKIHGRSTVSFPSNPYPNKCRKVNWNHASCRGSSSCSALSPGVSPVVCGFQGGPGPSLFFLFILEMREDLTCSKELLFKLQWTHPQHRRHPQTSLSLNRCLCLELLPLLYLHTLSRKWTVWRPERWIFFPI